MTGVSGLGELAASFSSAVPLTDERAAEILRLDGFTDGRAAFRSLQRMAAAPEEQKELGSLLPQLVTSLRNSAAPDTALISLERFVRSLPGRARILRYFRSHVRSLEILITLFAGSRFLTEILLRHPESVSSLSRPWSLAVSKRSTEILEMAQAAVEGSGSGLEHDDAVRRFQRLELLRIGACDLLGLFDLDAVTRELTALADGLASECLEAAERETGISADGFSVVAMGKLGGRELNYSSDIDLLFLAKGNAARYWPLGKRLIEALSRTTAEGFLYRVDMRLRPWGEAGPLVSSHEGYLGYLRKHARLWEKQALLKARVIAGDEPAGKECLLEAEPLLFEMNKEAARGEVRAMRQLTEREVRRKGLERSEVKLGEGSIRDVEFVVQYLQLAFGGEAPQIRGGNTREVLGCLEKAGILPSEDLRVLREGYVFLRTIEHHLQVMHYRQTHTLPADAAALHELARRLGFTGERAGTNFLLRHGEHATAIRAVYMKYLGGETMLTETAPAPAAPSESRHTARMDPSYVMTFDEAEIKRHAVLAEQLDDVHLVAVDTTPLPDGLVRVTVVGYDYPGELSLICGLLFSSGFGILHAEAFTYEPLAPQSPQAVREGSYRSSPAAGTWQDPRRGRAPMARTGQTDARRKTVDVFVVSPLREEMPAGVWEAFAESLNNLLGLLRAGKHGEARGEIARRAAGTQQAIAGARVPLYPVDIEIDNGSSEKYTVLRIDAPDTAGFLYELTNALSLGGIYISRLTAGSIGSRVHDTLWVTDAKGLKITAHERQRELRAATVLIKHFTHLLPQAPNPEAALLHFGEFMGQLFSRPDWPSELASLESPKVLDALARLLGVSDFLWADFLRMQHANIFPVVRDVDVLASGKTRPQLEKELEDALLRKEDETLETRSPAGWRAALNAFKDRELFRIDMRHILGHTVEIAQFSRELGDLSEIVCSVALAKCEEELQAVYGRPLFMDGSPCPLSAAALGKCGGREMGFASDIELMFIYAGSGRTEGPSRITASEYFEKLVQAFVGAIRAKKEGVFEIDLRLRPYGNAGSMAVSLDAFRRYFSRTGPAWPYERQSLIRLRPIAGDAILGLQLVELRDSIVYDGVAPDVTAIRAMRERQVRHLVTPGTFNPKFSPGGLVDVEYLVQGLQIQHGHENPALRSTNTREAMAALTAAGILSDGDHERLEKAQVFLRWLIEALRVVRGNARDVTIPPFGSEEFSFLGRRLNYTNSLAELKEEMARVSSTVRELNARLLG